MGQEKLKYLNLTDLEVIGLLNGTCTQLMRRAKVAEASTVAQVNADLDAFGPVGNIIGCREAWRVGHVYPDKGQVGIEYRVGGRNFWDNLYNDYHKYYRMRLDKKWRPASQMPKFSIRITLKIKELHVHRLTDLREEDAKLLGLDPSCPEPSAKDAYFSWYRCTHGSTNFHGNDWQVRAEVEIIQPPQLLFPALDFS